MRILAMRQMQRACDVSSAAAEDKVSRNEYNVSTMDLKISRATIVANEEPQGASSHVGTLLGQRFPST